MYKDLFEDLTLSPLPFIREGGFQLWYFTEIWVPLLLAICHAKKMFNFSFRWPTKFALFYYLVERFKTLENAKKHCNPPFYLIHSPKSKRTHKCHKRPSNLWTVSTLFFVLVATVAYRSLTSNCSKILMHYPLPIQLWFALGSVSNSCPTFLFIYLFTIYLFTILIYFTLA